MPLKHKKHKIPQKGTIHYDQKKHLVKFSGFRAMVAKKNGACEHRPRQTQKNRIMKKLINYNVWR